MPRDLSFERAIRFAADLIRIPGLPGREAEVAARVLRELEALGFDDVWSDEVGNALGRIRGRAAAPPILLSSHLDVVDAGDPASWTYPPYAGEIDGGFLHGRGAMDIKGPLAIQTYAAAHFLDDRPPGDIVVGHTVLEERGGWGMAHLLEHGDVNPGAVVIGEATAGDICIGHRGRAEVLVEVHGEAGHASAPDRARSALDPLPDVLVALRAFARELPADDLLGPSTLAATGVYTSPASPNVIPDLARVVADWRLLPGWTADEVLDRLRDFLADRVPAPDDFRIEVRFATEEQVTYTGLRRTRALFTPGFLLRPDHPVARAAAAAVAAATGREPAIRPWTFATDGGHACGVHGIPTVGYAPGEERHAHTVTERLDLDAARTVYDAYPRVVLAVQRTLREDPVAAGS